MQALPNTSGQGAEPGDDISVSHQLPIRVGEFDYVLTRYTNPLASTNNQNNFRYTGGVILKF
jgi:hypothetical protein